MFLLLFCLRTTYVVGTIYVMGTIMARDRKNNASSNICVMINERVKIRSVEIYNLSRIFLTIVNCIEISVWLGFVI